jgi:hypothetical protein
MSVIEKYKALGWKFEISYWESSHNGDIDYEYKVTSPRIKEPFYVYLRGDNKTPTDSEEMWKFLTEKELLRTEAYHYANMVWKKDGYTFEYKIIEALAEGHEKVTIDLREYL